jgi:hypothetical protein
MRLEAIDRCPVVGGTFVPHISQSTYLILGQINDIYLQGIVIYLSAYITLEWARNTNKFRNS